MTTPKSTKDTAEKVVRDLCVCGHSKKAHHHAACWDCWMQNKNWKGKQPKGPFICEKFRTKRLLASKRQPFRCQNSGVGHHCYVEVSGKQVRNPNCRASKRGKKVGKG